MKDMLDRSLSPKQKGSVSGRLLSFIAAGLAMLVVGGFALGVRGVNKRITQHRADVPTAPEKLRVQKVTDVSERGLVEVLVGGRMKSGEAISIKGRLFPFNDPKTGDAVFMPLSACDAENKPMEVARSEDQSNWGVDSRLTQDENGDLTILEQTDSYISATRKTVETDKGAFSVRYLMIGDYPVYSWEDEGVYSPDDIKNLKAALQSVTGDLAQAANRASFDAKYPDNDSRRVWLEKQMADEVTLKDGKLSFTQDILNVFLTSPELLMPQKANLSCWEASVENGEKTVPSDIIEMKGGNAAGFFDMKVTEISEPSAFIEGEDVPVVIDLTQRLYGDATHLDPRLQLSVYPDAVQFSFGWTTPAGDEVSIAMSQVAGEKTERTTVLWKRDNDRHVSLELPVGLNDNQVMGLVRSLNAMAQRVKGLGKLFDEPGVSREDVGSKRTGQAPEAARP